MIKIQISLRQCKLQFFFQTFYRFLFAQDPSSIQASPSVAAFLRQQQVQCCEWPARGPDCNPCDLLWEELETSMPGGAASSQQELVQRVRRGYEAIDQEYVRWLVAPPRIRSLCRRMMRMRTVTDDNKEQWNLTFRLRGFAGERIVWFFLK